MVRVLAGISALLLLLLLGWFIWSSPEAPSTVLPPEPPPPAQPMAPLPAEATQPKAAPAARADETHGQQLWLTQLADDEAPEAMDPKDPAAAVLKGRLTVRQQPWQHPAGVRIRLTRSWLDTVVPTQTAPEERLPARNEPEAVTDEQGFFALGFVPTGGELFFVIDPKGPWHDFQRAPTATRRSGTQDIGDLFVDQRGTIVGRLVDHSGAPISGMELRAVDDPLLDVGSDLDAMRSARMEALEHFRADGALASGPMPAWVVQRDRHLPFPTTATAKDGSFELRHLRPGSHDVFGNDGQGRAAACRGVLVTADGTTDVGTITLLPTVDVFCDFVDEDIKPWANHPVAFVHQRSGFAAQHFTTRSDGSIHARVVAPEECTLMFGYSQAGPWVPIPAEPGQMQFIVPRMPEVRIMLADAAGRPLGFGSLKTYLTAAVFRLIDRRLPPAMQPREESPGSFVARVLPGMLLVGAASGYAPAVAVAGEQPALTMRLLPLAKMRLRAIDGQARPVAGVEVRMKVHGHPDQRFPGSAWGALRDSTVTVGRTNPDGELDAPVWATFLSFDGSHPDFARSPGPKVFGGGSPPLYLLPMVGRADVVGRLTCQGRPAPAGYRVRARMTPPPQHPLAESGLLPERLAVVGEGGAFAFRDLVAGVWELTPELPAVPSPSGAKRPPRPFRRQQHDLPPGQETHLVLEAQRDPSAPQSLCGVVRQNGNNVVGAIVHLRPSEALPDKATAVAAKPQPPSRSSRRRPSTRRDRMDVDEASPLEIWTHRCDTDVFGEFAFSDLPAGAWFELRVDVPVGGRMQCMARQRVQVPSSPTLTPIPFHLASTQAQLHCTSDDRPFASRMLRLQQLGGDGKPAATFDLLTDRFGVAATDSLPLGTWRVMAPHGGACTPQEFTVGTTPVVMTIDVAKS